MPKWRPSMALTTPRSTRANTIMGDDVITQICQGKSRDCDSIVRKSVSVVHCWPDSEREDDVGGFGTLDRVPGSNVNSEGEGYG